MIQRMGQAKRKEQQSWFVLLTPKQTQVKRSDKIEKIFKKCQTTRATFFSLQLSTTNQTNSIRPSLLVQEIDLDVFDNKSVQGFGNKEAKNEFHDPAIKKIFNILSTKAKIETQSQKIKKQASKTDAQKRASLPKEIFDYIHIAKC